MLHHNKIFDRIAPYISLASEPNNFDCIELHTESDETLRNLPGLAKKEADRYSIWCVCGAVNPIRSSCTHAKGTTSELYWQSHHTALMHLTNGLLPRV
mmetsp:Transcript_12633/g.26613  ORF Transcript_12633/g.26613 Transcript_12633/m.26613 type:complete len:98 (-) Transcript_12633:341-634(-)